MLARLACPYCNTTFEHEVRSVGERAACPRCGETFVVKSLPDPATPTTAATTLPDARFAPALAPPRKRSLVGWVAGGVAVLAVIMAVALYLRNQSSKPGPDPVARPQAPPATKPPALLTGVRLLPPETTIVLAVQPSPLLQYAARTEKDPAKLLADAGLPGSMVETLTRLGLPLEEIDHLAIGVSFGTSFPPPVQAVLALRNEMKDDSQLRKELKAKASADRPGRYTVELAGLPMQMSMRDKKTYLFASADKELDAILKKSPEDIAHLRVGLRDSIQELSPSSFVWLATDSENWSKNQLLQMAASIGKMQDLPKKLEGLRAAALGLSIEPELQWRLSVRTVDAAAAQSLSTRAAATIASAKGTALVSGDWLTILVPFEPPQDVRQLLLKLLESK